MDEFYPVVCEAAKLIGPGSVGETFLAQDLTARNRIFQRNQTDGEFLMILLSGYTVLD